MVTQTAQAISIKGILEGLLITLGDGPYGDVLTRLEEELAQKQTFLQGSRVALAVGERPLRRDQLGELQDLFARRRLMLWTVLAEKEVTKTAARELGLATRLPGSSTDLDGNVLTAASPPPTPAPAPQEKKASNGAEGLFLKETLRSGRSVYHEGHVVIMGDVNPGAEIIAAGDVIVWGRLRGLVHAGALGDETAVICALELNPTQLRIANVIAISPHERQRKIVPEQATCRGGQIVAEPWPAKS
jgi:septum site-determining protein MinC